jgi:tetratricopeptide (TPR) repeat protein
MDGSPTLRNQFLCFGGGRTVPPLARAFRVLVALVALLGGLLAAPPARAQTAKADIEAKLEKGFARIVITFRDRMLLPQFVSKLNNGVLVLQFGEPVQVAVDRVPQTLPAFVNIARRDADGQALRFALARQVRVNTMEAGERLFVDLLPATWQGPPPPLPDTIVAELAKRADAALKAQREAETQRFGLKINPKVDFAVGRHPTFARLAFTWNVPFDTQMAREGERVTLTFNRIAAIDFAPIVVDPPPTLKEISAEEAGEGRMRVVMVIAPDADVRGFREEQSYIVDLSTPRPPANPLEAAARKATGQADAMPAGARQRVVAPGAPAPSPGAEPAADGPEAHAAAKPADPHGVAAPAKEAMARPAPAKAAKPSDPQAVAKPAPVPPVAAPGAAAVLKEAAQPDHDEDAVPPTQGGENRAGGDEPPAGMDARPDMRDPNDKGAGAVRVEAKRIGNIVRIAFPFPSRVSSAAFKRDDVLWVLFDSALPLDTSAVATALGPLARSLGVQPSGQGQALRIELGQPLLTTLGADGNSWILSVGELVLEPARPLQMTRNVRKSGQSQLIVDLADAGALHELDDPRVGDKIFAVTAFGPPRGLIKTYSFTELDSLPAAHGLAVVPRVDDLKVQIEFEKVVISRERGLTLSTGALDPARLTVPRKDLKARRQEGGADSFAARDPAEFTGKVREITEAITRADAGQKNAARFQLAELYIAHRLAPEALGVLRLVANDEPGVERDPGFIILNAAAQAMLGRNEEARRALARAEVEDNPEAALWRTVAANGAARFDEAREAAVKTGSADSRYPPDVQALFAISAAEASTELNDFAGAQARVAEVAPEEIAPDLRARYELLKARLADAAGRGEDALQHLDRATETGDRAAAAEAEYRRIRMGVRDKTMEVEDAIEQLQSLAFGWRGNDIELKTLRFLANLQAQTGRFRDAFNNMRSALMINPDAETTRLLQDEMQREYISLYLDGKADRLEPVQALALYYDFRDLMPISQLGDQIVRKLADRLVAVDLLDPAAELLTHQIDNRLRGAARARVAADLAVVHLLDRKPEQALAVINKTRQPQLPASVERQRRIVEARALSETGRSDLALELIAPLSGSDADRLKADILWRAKRWHEAGDRLETMLAGRWSDGTPLDLQERQDVLRAGVAFALANDQLALDRLRTKFGPKMKDSPNAATFDVVTGSIQTQGSDFRQIAKEIASVDTLKTFLDEYRTQYLSGKPSAPADEKAPNGKPEPSADAGKPAMKMAEAAPAKPAKGEAKDAKAEPKDAKTAPKEADAGGEAKGGDHGDAKDEKAAAH